MLTVLGIQLPINLKKFVNKAVLVKCKDDIEVEGFLVDADNSQHGRLGNVLVTTENGRLALIRGNMIQLIAILRRH
jgi:small nuclear ribonucleoprotein (snRNP)-like protein